VGIVQKVTFGAVVGLLVTCRDKPPVGCTKDTDCKGDRICTAGTCVSSVQEVDATPLGTGGRDASNADAIGASIAVESLAPAKLGPAAQCTIDGTASSVCDVYLRAACARFAECCNLRGSCNEKCVQPDNVCTVKSCMAAMRTHVDCTPKRLGRTLCTEQEKLLAANLRTAAGTCAADQWHRVYRHPFGGLPTSGELQAVL
jgi:hypothetical protein